MKKRIVLIILGIVLIAAFFTNPGLDTHKQHITTTVKEACSAAVHQQVQGTSDDDIVGGLFDLFGTALVENASNIVLNSNLTYHNYFVCSSTSIILKGEQKTISYGCFGKVFTISKDELTDYLKKELQLQ